MSGGYRKFDPSAVLGERATMARGRQPELAPVARDPMPETVRTLPWEAGIAALRDQRRPSSITIQRWAQLIADCARLSETWGQRALDLGWGELDLFGCNPVPHPKAGRLDRDGVAINLCGRFVVAMTADTITIETEAKDRWTYHRKPLDRAVTIWVAMARMAAEEV